MNPEQHPGRLEGLISALLGQKVRLLSVIPNEGIRLAEDGTFVIMDITAELEDYSIVDVEIQKIGYKFTGRRTSCYSADFIMRQYSRISARCRKENRKFRKAAPVYLHHNVPVLDSGVCVDFLDKITYVCLDTFHENVCTYTGRSRPEY